MVLKCKDKSLSVGRRFFISSIFPFMKSLKVYLLPEIYFCLSSINKRKQAINELIRVTKKGGKILILVWAFEQEKSSRFNFTKQDNYIDWKDKDKNIIGKRFYHVFKQNELEELIDKSLKYESFYEKGNRGVIISL